MWAGAVEQSEESGVGIGSNRAGVVGSSMVEVVEIPLPCRTLVVFGDSTQGSGPKGDDVL